MTDQYHSILGLPESGKTTFLAALWHIIDAGEITTGLQLHKLEGNNGYLNQIVEAWRKCVKVPRTSGQEEAEISIHMYHPATDQSFVLGFPDLAGESFDDQFSKRECTTEYLANSDREGGLMLFLNADRGQDGIGIVELAEVLDDADEEPQYQKQNDWSHHFVPEQVRLVDLLQFMQRSPFRVRHRRLAIAISAWDVVDDATLEPAQWLERECPLLHQYLISNAEYFEVKVFGISAQGGDVPRDIEGASAPQQQSRDDLLKQLPSERVKCVGAGTDTDERDLTAPICWLMGLN